jgi:nucleoid-associated protein YgaU
VHKVIAGDSLASIAFREYGDPAKWRPLAAANNIDDPIRLCVGTTLIVPAAGELAGG